jgi:hypothetical protein
MIRTTKLGAALVLALAVTATAAQAFTPAFDPAVDDLQGGRQVKLKPTKAQLGIISPADGVCPGAAKLTAWVFTNKPGEIDFMLVRQSGGVLGPYSVQTVETAGGKFMGTLNTGFMIDAPTDTAYRIVIAGTDVVSNWAPLTAC